MRWATLALFLVASTAAAQPHRDRGASTDAREAFTSGVDLMQKAQWDDALKLFQRSIELHPTQVALFDAAMCLKNLGRHDEAAAMLERLLREFGDQATEERRTEYRGQLEEIRAHMAQLVIFTDVEGAEVRVDGHVVGIAPLEGPIFVLPGEHVVGASRASLSPAEEHITVVAQEIRSVRLQLEPPPPGPPPAAPVPAPPMEHGPSTTWFWLSAGTAAVATLATGVLGTLALTGNATYESDTHRTRADRDAGKRLVLATDIALGIAVASGVTAVILWSVTDFDASGEEVRASRAPRLGVVLAPDRVAVALSGEL